MGKVSDLPVEQRMTFYTLKVAYYSGDDTALEALLDFIAEHGITSRDVTGGPHSREWHVAQRKTSGRRNAREYEKLLHQARAGLVEQYNW